jgi:hypothetical protein
MSECPKNHNFMTSECCGSPKSIFTLETAGLREAILLRDARMSPSVGRTAALEWGVSGGFGPVLSLDISGVSGSAKVFQTQIVFEGFWLTHVSRH